MTWTHAESKALEGKDKPAKLVALVDDVVSMDVPQHVQVGTMKASFSSYLVGADSKVASRVAKLSQEVYNYAQDHPGTAKTAILEDALRVTLSSLPLLTTLDGSYDSRQAPKAQAHFFEGTLVKNMTQIGDGLVNPYIFDKDRSEGPVCRDMTDVVSHANTVLSGGDTASGSPRDRLNFLREEIQGKLWTSDDDTYTTYEKFEKIDLKLDLGGDGPQNAYELLGLSADVDCGTLAETLESQKASGYVDANSDNKGSNSCIRNAAFQLQTSEGKAVYDLSLKEKVQPNTVPGIKENGVSEADALVFGTAQGGIRFGALRHCITKAMDAIPR